MARPLAIVSGSWSAFPRSRSPRPEFTSLLEEPTRASGSSAMVRPRRRRTRHLLPRTAGRKVNGQSRPVSRVLSPRALSSAGEADIPLGPALPQASSERTRERGGPPHVLPYLLLLQVGLAVPPVSPRARCALTAPFHPCRHWLKLPAGGLFSVALSRESPRLAVNQHPALWSPDFPPALIPPGTPSKWCPQRLAAPASARTALTAAGSSRATSPRRWRDWTSRRRGRSPRAGCA